MGEIARSTPDLTPAQAALNAQAQAATMAAVDNGINQQSEAEEAQEAVDAVGHAAPTAADIVEMTSGEENDKAHVRTSDEARKQADDLILGQEGSDFKNKEDLRQKQVKYHQDFARLVLNDYHDKDLAAQFKNTTAGKWQDWYNGHPEYSMAKEYVLGQFDSLQYELIGSLAAKLEKHEATTAATKGQLDALSKEFKLSQDEAVLAGLNRYVTTMGQSYKMLHERTSDHTDVNNARSETEVMDEVEMALFIDSLRRMQLMPFEKMVDMITRNQDIITMLAAQEAYEGTQLFKDQIGKDGVGDKRGPLKQFLQVQPDDENQPSASAQNNPAKVRDPLKIDNSAPELSDSRATGEMVNDHNYVRLAQLIAGNAPTLEERAAGKTTATELKDERVVTVESFDLAPRVLSRLEPAQREYLAYVINKVYGAAETEKYIKGAFAGGVMTVADLNLIAERNPDLRWVNSASMMKKVEVIIKQKERQDRANKLNADRMLGRYQESAFIETISPRGLAGAAMYVGGILTAVVNGSLIIADAIKGGHDFDTAATNFLTCGYIWGGIGAAVAGNHILSGPDFLNDFLNMSSEQRKNIALRDQFALFNNTILTYPKLTGYMKSRWDTYKNTASLNKINDNPRSGKVKRNEYKLEPNDIDLDVVNLYEQTGIRDPKEARERIAMLFNSLHGPMGEKDPLVGKDPTADQFESFVNKRVLKGFFKGDKPLANVPFNYATTPENESHGNIVPISAPDGDSNDDIAPALMSMEGK